MVLCNGAAWQISAWLSALRQPAHQSAALKCHMPSPWRASCPAAVSTTPSVLQGCSGHSQFGMHPRAVVHSLYPSIKVRGISTAKISCVYSQLAAPQAQFHPVTQRGNWRMQRSSIIHHQGTVGLFSLAVPSRTSLTFRSSRHLQAPLVGSLRAAHSGAAYLGR